MAEEINFEDEVRRLLDAEPFHDFTIILTSGDRLEVTDPHAVAIGTTTMAVFPPRSASHWIRKNQIVAVAVKEHTS